MKDAVLYIHGKGGSSEEAAHYVPLFPSACVSGIGLKSFTPREAGREIHEAAERLRAGCDRLFLIANSIGAFFSFYSEPGELFEHAFLISPVIDMVRLIGGMMARSGVTEAELKEKRSVVTDSGDELSWDYLSFVRDNPVRWDVPTDILYGSGDNITPYATVASFARAHRAGLTVMDNGEHWFHTEEQMLFMDNWIRKCNYED